MKEACNVEEMLQLGDAVTCFSAVFVLVLLGTRSAVCSVGLTAILYLFLVVFRFPQVPASRARQVLRPGRLAPGGVSVVAHRAGAHDAPENTIAAIKAVSLLVLRLLYTCKYEYANWERPFILIPRPLAKVCRPVTHVITPILLMGRSNHFTDLEL